MPHTGVSADRLCGFGLILLTNPWGPPPAVIWADTQHGREGRDGSASSMGGNDGRLSRHYCGATLAFASGPLLLTTLSPIPRASFLTTVSATVRESRSARAWNQRLSGSSACPLPAAVA